MSFSNSSSTLSPNRKNSGLSNVIIKPVKNIVSATHKRIRSQPQGPYGSPKKSQSSSGGRGNNLRRAINLGLNWIPRMRGGLGGPIDYPSKPTDSTKGNSTKGNK